MPGRKFNSNFGSAGTLIKCPGIGRLAPFLDRSCQPAHVQRKHKGRGAFRRAVLADLRAAGDGLIINGGSRTAVDPHPHTTAARKAALHAFSNWPWKSPEKPSQ
jgi:short-subunit dehydrogenase